MSSAARPLRIFVLCGIGALAAGFQTPEETALLARRDEAIEQVKRIVNEPAEALPRPPDAQVAMFRPGWFHEGAIRPNFLYIDVRATQQFPYDRYEYVTSDLNPGVMFRGRDLEFNAMTKYFYTDRSVPKKRLGPADMDEINRLYRIIGRAENDLARVRQGLPPEARTEEPAVSTGILALSGAAVAVLAGLFVVQRRRRSRLM